MGRRSDVQAALSLKEKEDFTGAVALLEDLVQEFPDSAVGQGLLGSYCFFLLNDSQKALPHLRAAVRLSPTKEMSSLALFHCLWNLDRRDEALEEMKRYQLLTNWRCRDYLEIMDEINEKWGETKQDARRSRA